MSEMVEWYGNHHLERAPHKSSLGSKLGVSKPAIETSIITAHHAANIESLRTPDLVSKKLSTALAVPIEIKARTVKTKSLAFEITETDGTIVEKEVDGDTLASVSQHFTPSIVQALADNPTSQAAMGDPFQKAGDVIELIQTHGIDRVSELQPFKVDTLSGLSATEYHGHVVHVHPAPPAPPSEGAMYFAHNGDWVKILDERTTLFSGNYNDLMDTPSLFSGNYDDLTNQPSFTFTDPAVEAAKEDWQTRYDTEVGVMPSETAEAKTSRLGWERPTAENYSINFPDYSHYYDPDATPNPDDPFTGTYPTSSPAGIDPVYMGFSFYYTQTTADFDVDGYQSGWNYETQNSKLIAEWWKTIIDMFGWAAWEITDRSSWPSPPSLEDLQDEWDNNLSDEQKAWISLRDDWLSTNGQKPEFNSFHSEFVKLNGLNPLVWNFIDPLVQTERDNWQTGYNALGTMPIETDQEKTSRLGWGRPGDRGFAYVPAYPDYNPSGDGYGNVTEQITSLPAGIDPQWIGKKFLNNLNATDFGGQTIGNSLWDYEQWGSRLLANWWKEIYDNHGGDNAYLTTDRSSWPSPPSLEDVRDEWDNYALTPDQKVFLREREKYVDVAGTKPHFKTLQTHLEKSSKNSAPTLHSTLMYSENLAFLYDKQKQILNQYKITSGMGSSIEEPNFNVNVILDQSAFASSKPEVRYVSSTSVLKITLDKNNHGENLITNFMDLVQGDMIRTAGSTIYSLNSDYTISSIEKTDNDPVYEFRLILSPQVTDTNDESNAIIMKRTVAAVNRPSVSLLNSLSSEITFVDENSIGTYGSALVFDMPTVINAHNVNKFDLNGDDIVVLGFKFDRPLQSNVDGIWSIYAHKGITSGTPALSFSVDPVEGIKIRCQVHSGFGGYKSQTTGVNIGQYSSVSNFGGLGYLFLQLKKSGENYALKQVAFHAGHEKQEYGPVTRLGDSDEYTSPFVTQGPLHVFDSAGQSEHYIEKSFLMALLQSRDKAISFESPTASVPNGGIALDAFVAVSIG